MNKKLPVNNEINILSSRARLNTDQSAYEKDDERGLCLLVARAML